VKEVNIRWDPDPQGKGAILREKGLAKVPELQFVCGGDAGFLSNYSDHIL